MECRLRKWDIRDAGALCAIISNKKVQNNLRDGIPYPYTKADAEFFITEMQQADPANTCAFAITVGGELAGSIAVYRQTNIHCRTGELGYYLGEPFWGKGIGTEAVRQMCKTVFEQTDIIRIFADPFAYNRASCRVLEKAGFQCEGVLHCNAVKNGQVLDMKMYALIRDDKH